MNTLDISLFPVLWALVSDVGRMAAMLVVVVTLAIIATVAIGYYRRNGQ